MLSARSLRRRRTSPPVSEAQFALAQQFGEEATADIAFVGRGTPGYLLGGRFFFRLNGEPVALERETLGRLSVNGYLSFGGRQSRR